MEILLEGKSVSKSIKSKIEEKLNKLEKKPKIAVLTLNPDDSNMAYIKKIEKNCIDYGIVFNLSITKTEQDFIK